MESQPQQQRYPPAPQQVLPHLAHVVNPQYALAPPPPHMSVPISGMPVPMHIPVAHPQHVSHHLPHPHPHPHSHSHSHSHSHPHSHTHPPPPHQHSEHIQPPPTHPQTHPSPLHLSQSQPHHHQPPPPLSAPPPPQHPQLPSLHPLPTPHYYDPASKIARLEADLDEARHEIDRLRTKLAEYEKERAKTETPKIQSRYWTPAEHKLFLEALQKFGRKDVRAIANYVGSRNATQVRTHAQKYFLRVAREVKNGNALQAARKRSMSESDLVRVGGNVRTPPGSPMREHRVPPPLDARMTEAEPVPSSLQPPHGAPQPTHPPMQPSGILRPPFNPVAGPSKMEPMSVSSTKPPTPIPPGVTGGKPPPPRPKIADNAGMNLLSLVASERKMETEKPSG